jgi:hypothetical protein
LIEDNNLPQQLYNAKTIMYDKCGFAFTEFIKEDESQEYGACTFKLNGLKIKYRISKITPTKTGQFVTIWKRGKDGQTEPLNFTDEIDFVIIALQNENNFGQFIFPKSVLIEKGIITAKNKEGKRGIRVYSPWDITTNKQAIKTQLWQTKYFLAINTNDNTDLALAKQLLDIATKKNLPGRIINT